MWRRRLDKRIRSVENRGMKPHRGCWSGWTRHPEPIISLLRTVADVIDPHVTLELECLDRVHLNVCQPRSHVGAAAIA